MPVIDLGKYSSNVNQVSTSIPTVTPIDTSSYWGAVSEVGRNITGIGEKINELAKRDDEVKKKLAIYSAAEVASTKYETTKQNAANMTDMDGSLLYSEDSGDYQFFDPSTKGNRELENKGILKREKYKEIVNKAYTKYYDDAKNGLNPSYQQDFQLFQAPYRLEQVSKLPVEESSLSQKAMVNHISQWSTDLQKMKYQNNGEAVETDPFVKDYSLKRAEFLDKATKEHGHIAASAMINKTDKAAVEGLFGLIESNFNNTEDPIALEKVNQQVQKLTGLHTISNYSQVLQRGSSQILSTNISMAKDLSSALLKTDSLSPEERVVLQNIYDAKSLTKGDAELIYNKSLELDSTIPEFMRSATSDQYDTLLKHLQKNYPLKKEEVDKNARAIVGNLSKQGHGLFTYSGNVNPTREHNYKSLIDGVVNSGASPEDQLKAAAAIGRNGVTSLEDDADLSVNKITTLSKSFTNIQKKVISDVMKANPAVAALPPELISSTINADISQLGNIIENKVKQNYTEATQNAKGYINRVAAPEIEQLSSEVAKSYSAIRDADTSNRFAQQLNEVTHEIKKKYKGAGTTPEMSSLDPRDSAYAPFFKKLSPLIKNDISNRDWGRVGGALSSINDTMGNTAMLSLIDNVGIPKSNSNHLISSMFMLPTTPMGDTRDNKVGKLIAGGGTGEINAKVEREVVQQLKPMFDALVSPSASTRIKEALKQSVTAQVRLNGDTKNTEASVKKAIGELFDYKPISTDTLKAFVVSDNNGDLQRQAHWHATDIKKQIERGDIKINFNSFLKPDQLRTPDGKNYSNEMKTKFFMKSLENVVLSNSEMTGGDMSTSLTPYLKFNGKLIRLDAVRSDISKGNSSIPFETLRQRYNEYRDKNESKSLWQKLTE